MTEHREDQTSSKIKPIKFETLENERKGATIGEESPVLASARNMRIWKDPWLIKYICDDLEKRLKRDIIAKLLVLFTALSAYLPEPINCSLKGSSGIGKTKNTTETMKYFPEEDIMSLGGLSPKALFHEHGTLLNRRGERIDALIKPLRPKRLRSMSKEEYDEVMIRYKKELEDYHEEFLGSYTSVGLNHRTLVFLEAPDQETYRILLPILSHDKKSLEFKFADRTETGQLRTKKVIVEGWPAAIFLSANEKYMEEMVTRSLGVTPESSKEKIGEAKKLRTSKVAAPWKYEKETEETKIIRHLILTIRDKFLNCNLGISIPFLNLEELFPEEIIRIMREYEHFTQLLQSITALHLFQRPLIKKNDRLYLLSSTGDVEIALSIFQAIHETTRTGTEEIILNFYHEIVETEPEWFLKDLTEVYNEKHPSDKRSSSTIGKWLTHLYEIQYVDIQKSQLDKRENKYIPIMKKSENESSSENQTNSYPKLKEGFESWLKDNGKENQFFVYDISTDKIELKEITIEQVKELILR